jgi:DNA polymerase III sliding clamp (beta) subunit (PCNA family)
MKIKGKAGQILEALQQTSQTLARKEDLPSSWLYLAARNGKEQRLLTYATDMVGKTLVKTPMDVEAEGEALIRPRNLLAFLASVPAEEEVTLSTDSSTENLRGRCLSIKVVVPVRAEGQSLAATVQDIPFGEKPLFTIKAKSLITLINRSMFCTTTERQLIFGCVYFMAAKDGYEACATDGNICVEAFIADPDSPGADSGVSLVVPAAGLQPLLKLLAKRPEEVVQVLATKNASGEVSTAYFRFSDVLYGTLLVTDTYPNIKSVIYNEAHAAKQTFLGDGALVADSVKRAIPFSENGRVQLVLKNNQVTVSSRGPITGSFQEAVEGTDPEQKIDATLVLGMSYVVPVLTNLHGPSLKLGISESGNHVRISDEADPEEKAVYLLGCIRNE